jgi:23S rRNA pseudouridine1911/1915/1917 synthase
VRIDSWLRERYPRLTRRHIEEALSAGLVTRRGGGRLARGDLLDSGSPPDCARLDAHLDGLRSGNVTLHVPVLAESADTLAVDKPPGVPCQPISLLERETVSHWAFARYPEIRAWATDCQPTVTPHRLDIDTSGVLLVARTRAAFDTWRRRFGDGRVTKRYLAWCWGRGPERELLIDAGIAHDPRDPRKMVAMRGTQRPHRGRVCRAETMVHIRRQLRDRFLAEITMRTGVTHQVRVHLAWHGTPLLGDRLYDDCYDIRKGNPERTQLRCIALCSGEFAVTAPSDEFEGRYG